MGFFRRASTSSPAYFRDYQACQKQRYHRKTPIREVEFVVLDTETTGFDAKKDRILSIGAVVVCNQSFDLHRQLEIEIEQSIRPTQDTISIHGILPKDLPGHLPEEQALQVLLDYLGHRIIVGHHIAFDKTMLNQLCKRYTGRTLHNPVLDTHTLARRAEHLRQRNFLNNQDYQLDTLAKRYHIPLADRHTAAGDSYITAILFMKLLHQLDKRGVKTLGQLMK